MTAWAQRLRLRVLSLSTNSVGAACFDHDHEFHIVCIYIYMYVNQPRFLMRSLIWWTKRQHQSAHQSGLGGFVDPLMGIPCYIPWYPGPKS